MTDLDRTALAEVAECMVKWEKHLELFEVKAALEAVFTAGQIGNKYFDESAPFKSRKTDLERCGVSIAVALQILRQITVMLSPITPFAMEKVWGWLGMESDLSQGGLAEARLDLPAGRELGKQEILFPRLDDDLIEKEVERLETL